LGVDRAVRTFETAYRGVAIEPDNEHVAELSCCRQILNMPTVENIETAIGEYDSLPLGAELIEPRCKFMAWDDHDRSIHGETFIARAALLRRAPML